MLAKIDPLAHTFHHREICCNRLILKMVGERGFEPPTPWSRTRCSTRLSHSPTRVVERIGGALPGAFFPLITLEPVYQNPVFCGLIGTLVQAPVGEAETL